MFDGKAFGEEIVGFVREYLDKEVALLKAENAALAARCKALEDVVAKPVEIDLTDVEKLIATEIAKLPDIPELPELPDFGELVAHAVNEAVAALPSAQDGKSVEIEDVLPVIAAEVAKAFEAVPVPKDGEPGKDGRGVKELLIDREGHLIATMDDGATKDLGPVLGRDGEPGKDGANGFELDDFDCQPVDERTIAMSFVRGEVKHSYELQFPVVVYRGVFKEGEPYERGDMVTWGGSLWHCDAPTKDKPGTDSWTLAAKKGRDGKDLTKNG